LLKRDGVHAKLLDVRGWRAIPMCARRIVCLSS
jgi:hypothetical protein